MSYVLVVEDDEAISELVEEVLTDEGYAVRCAQSGAEALALAEQEQPSLILADMGLAAGSGAALIESYRQMPEARARIVLVSGMARLQQEAARLNVDGFVCKPFELDALIGTVASALAPTRRVA
jgi:CheY-like chemotaxis protein